jgi:hypothetical protein
MSKRLEAAAVGGLEICAESLSARESFKRF